MTCVMARSTDKGKMERDKVKRERDRPGADTERETRMRRSGCLPPGLRAFSVQAWACQERPGLPRTSFPSPLTSTGDSSPEWSVGRSSACHFQLALLGSTLGFSHALFAEDSTASEVAETTPEGAGEPTLPADQRCHTDPSGGESRSVLCYQELKGGTVLQQLSVPQQEASSVKGRMSWASRTDTTVPCTGHRHRRK